LQHINSLIHIKIVYLTNSKKIKEKKTACRAYKNNGNYNAFHGVGTHFLDFFYETVAKIIMLSKFFGQSYSVWFITLLANKLPNISIIALKESYSLISAFYQC